MKLIIALLAIGLLASCNRAPRNILLRLKYKKNQLIDVRYRSYIYKDNDEDNPIKNEYVRVGLTVDSVTRDSSYIFSAKILTVRSKNTGMLGQQDYYSDRDTDQMSTQEKAIHLQVKDVISLPYTFTLDSRGQKLQPFSIKGGLKATMPVELIDLDLYQITFPKEKIALGEEWTNETNIKGAKRISNYYIQRIDSAGIQIGVEGRLEKNGHSQRFFGTYILDKDTRALMSGKIEMDAETMMEGKVKAVIEVES